MKEKNQPPLIEVIQNRQRYPTLINGIAKFKGKLLHPEVLNICDHEYVEVAMPAEIIFDFNAGELRESMLFGVLMTEGECIGLLQDVSLYREKRYVIMQFNFSFDSEHPPQTDLNPYLTILALFKALKNEKHKVKDEEDSEGFSVSVAVPFRDNVYSHYKKHLAAFEKICRPIEEDAFKRLSKRLKTAKP